MDNNKGRPYLYDLPVIDTDLYNSVEPDRSDYLVLCRDCLDKTSARELGLIRGERELERLHMETNCCEVNGCKYSFCGHSRDQINPEDMFLIYAPPMTELEMLKKLNNE